MTEAIPSIGRPASSHAVARRIFCTSVARNGPAPSRGTRIPRSIIRSTSASVAPASSASPAADNGSMSLSKAPPAGLVLGEVVAGLVAAGALLGELHEAVVEQAGGAEAEPLRGEPVGTEGLVDQDQVLDGLLGGADPAGRLHADHAAGAVVEVADRLEHDQRDRQGGCRLDLAGGGLDE